MFEVANFLYYFAYFASHFLGPEGAFFSSPVLCPKYFSPLQSGCRHRMWFAAHFLGLLGADVPLDATSVELLNLILTFDYSDPTKVLVVFSC